MEKEKTTKRKRKRIIGIIVTILAALIILKISSVMNEEVNHWENLSETDTYVKEMKSKIEPAAEGNKKISKIVNDIAENKDKEKTLKEIESAKTTFLTINKNLKDLGEYKNEKDQKLEKLINDLQKVLISYSDIQYQRLDVYEEYVGDENEMIIEKMGRLEMQLKENEEEHKEIRDKIEKHFK